MVSSIFNTLVGLGGLRATKKSIEKTVAKTEKPNPVRALPGSWYTSPEMYELEKRAIFHRRWLLITHSLRLKRVGDWLKYDTANVDFVLYRDTDETIRGKRDVSSFDEITEDHLKVHIHIDYNGLIWVNLDENEEPEIKWDDLFAGIDRQERYGTLDFKNYEFDHSWQLEGPYNWKIASDNYNECYHCTTTHPDLCELTNITSYYVEPSNGYIKHFVGTKPDQEAKGLRVHPTYFYPSTSMNISLNFFMLQRFIPHGPLSSTMYYEVYRNKNAADEDFRLINEVYKRVMSEDKVLCELSQWNISQGTFVNGEMHPRLEMGPLFIQKLCREDVTEYYRRHKVSK